MGVSIAFRFQEVRSCLIVRTWLVNEINEGDVAEEMSERLNRRDDAAVN
jgi:hypothetical protein